MKYRWCIEAPQPLLAERLARSLLLSPVVAQCLINRGYASEPLALDFLEPRLKNLADPFLLPGMQEAVARLLLAREKSEPLVIFGDYDVDGVTSTTLLLEVLEALGWKAASYLPDRRSEGYGLSMDAVARCIAKHPATLLLAVDCGSTSVEAIAWLKKRGVDVIVVDHHQPSQPLPEAVAIVNPLAAKPSPDSNGKHAPFSELCSVGLSFKLAHALVKRGRDAGRQPEVNYDLRPLLDLVALGTIADVVPLVRENRILASAGLERLATTVRPGIVALKQVAGCTSRMGVHEVGFQLAPRLNAAGRLETAEDALRLLRSSSVAEATPLAQQLHDCNQERQTIEQQTVESALTRITERVQMQDDVVIIEGDADWHIGVVGIVAARVLQRFYKPTIIFGGDGAHWRGSGRSIAGFDLASALRDCDDLLVRHGGHAMAAGVTIEPARIALFRDRLNDVARRSLGKDELRPCLRLDSEVGLEELSLNLLNMLDRMRPFGAENPVPQFVARGLTHERPLMRMGSERQHVKMRVTDGAATHEAVWWGAGERSLPVGRFDLAFEPTLNHYNGRTTIQLKVLDWRPAEQSGSTAQLQL